MNIDINLTNYKLIISDESRSRVYDSKLSLAQNNIKVG